MKSTIATLFAALVLVIPLSAREPDAKELAAADDARVAATIAADKPALEKILADDLHYAHSSGTVDTKASFIETLVSGRNRYVKFDYLKRDITFPAPGIALVTGQVAVKTESPAKGASEFTLTYLGVWKLDNGGGWKFRAWQSARLNPPAPAN